jgi:hypothetical protein
MNSSSFIDRLKRDFWKGRVPNHRPRHLVAHHAEGRQSCWGRQPCSRSRPRLPRRFIQSPVSGRRSEDAENDRERCRYGREQRQNDGALPTGPVSAAWRGYSVADRSSNVMVFHLAAFARMTIDAPCDHLE